MNRYVTNSDGSYSAEWAPGKWIRTMVRPDGEELPSVVAAPKRYGYDAQDVTAMREQAAETRRIEQEQETRKPISMDDLARWRMSGIATHLGGIAPGSPDARLEEGKRVIYRPGDAAKTFARSAVAGALDTAALPVTLPARAARAAGVPGLDTAADLQADEALQDATWLATGEDAAPYRARVAKEREDFPTVAAAGAETGASLATAPLAAAGAGARRGVSAARGAAQAPAGAQQSAYASGGAARDADVFGSAALGGATALALTPAGTKRTVGDGESQKMRLYRAAEDDIVTDTASFAENLDDARAYLDNPGFGGRNLYQADVEVDPKRVLDLTDIDDPTEHVADLLGKGHPGAIGADEYVPRVSYDIREAGYDWVKVRESYPKDTTTWIWVGGDDPEMVGVEP